MSRIFKRPMFRKGGNVGEGIMTGIVDREMHAESDINGVGSQNRVKELTKQNLDLLMQNIPEDKGYDPLTTFLLQYGPSIATQTGGRGLIGNLVGAAEKPIASLLTEKAEQKKFLRDLKSGATQLGIEQAGKETLLDKEIQARLDLEAGKIKPDAIYEATLQEDFATYPGQPQVAQRAAKFKTTRADDLYDKVGSRTAGVLTFDISDPEQVKANAKQLKKMDGKFVYDPYANNYKKINVQKGVIGQPTTYMDIESINLKEVTNGADTGPVVEMTEYQKEILAGIPKYREEQKKLKEEKQKQSRSDVAEQYKNVPSIGEDYL